MGRRHTNYPTVSRSAPSGQRKHVKAVTPAPARCLTHVARGLANVARRLTNLAPDLANVARGPPVAVLGVVLGPVRVLVGRRAGGSAQRG
jgi:hypothetical protein